MKITVFARMSAQVTGGTEGNMASGGASEC